MERFSPVNRDLGFARTPKQAERQTGQSFSPVNRDLGFARVTLGDGIQF